MQCFHILTADKFCLGTGFLVVVVNSKLTIGFLICDVPNLGKAETWTEMTADDIRLSLPKKLI